MNLYKAYGRLKAGTWDKPHKRLRVAANRATRKLAKRELVKLIKESTECKYT